MYQVRTQHERKIKRILADKRGQSSDQGTSSKTAFSVLIRMLIKGGFICSNPPTPVSIFNKYFKAKNFTRGAGKHVTSLGKNGNRVGRGSDAKKLLTSPLGHDQGATGKGVSGQKIKAKWSNESLAPVLDKANGKSTSKRAREMTEIRMMELKSRIFRKLKEKTRNERKLGTVYHFLNKNLLLMVDKFAKKRFSKNEEPNLQQFFKICKLVVGAEKKIISQIFETAKVYN